MSNIKRNTIKNINLNTKRYLTSMTYDLESKNILSSFLKENFPGASAQKNWSATGFSLGPWTYKMSRRSLSSGVTGVWSESDRIHNRETNLEDIKNAFFGYLLTKTLFFLPALPNEIANIISPSPPRNEISHVLSSLPIHDLSITFNWPCYFF